MRAVGLLLAATIVVGACGDSSGTGDAPTTTAGVADTAVGSPDFVLEFENGALVGGFRREEVDLGSTVRVVARGDFTESIHLHGYDLYLEPADGDSMLEFVALIPGRFEIELEESSELLVQLTVR